MASKRTGKGEMITFRLDAARAQQLEYLVLNQDYENKSEALRDAVDLLIATKLHIIGAEAITLTLSEDAMRGCHELLDLGVGTSLAMIVEKAVDTYVSSKIIELDARENAYSSLRKRFDRQRAAKRRLGAIVDALEEP